MLAHPSIIGGDIGRRGLGEKGFTLQCSVGGDMRREWLAAEFALVDEDSYGFVSEDVAVATICKLCPGIKKIKVRRFLRGILIVHGCTHIFMSVLADIK